MHCELKALGKRTLYTMKTTSGLGVCFSLVVQTKAMVILSKFYPGKMFVDEWF